MKLSNLLGKARQRRRKWLNRWFGQGQTRSQRASVAALAVGGGCLAATFGLTADWWEAVLAFWGMVLCVVGVYGALTTLGEDDA